MLRHLPSKVYLSCSSTDLKKSIDGLAIIVQENFKLNPFDNALFVFCNRKREKIKILHWEHNGFWLYYKRLEKGVFKWPSSSSKKTLCISPRELSWLLDGLSLHQNTAHKSVTQRVII
ncbi:IS66 family insertion sequence element accessory protein TnpB [Paramaledivibacter caminithermalis]|uniref:IS66 Orf2 like protein n=1 Tax=Paramaledivibacter caminithermalis (strain DSM 15212 / CIP 107654 / DViRD3) TaxID=1121301 RepID=A0A1M6TUV2_PARC5|nr:IS66 Orf2 like protein [Paramaledivibacter caminithermalis DSM 15212]